MIPILVAFTVLVISASSTDEGQMSAAEIQYCCNLVSDMTECYTACMKFASKCPPVVQNKTEYLTEFCPEIPSTLDVCLSNTNLSNPAQSKPTPSPELVACCSTSQNEACEDVCIEELYIGNLDDEAIQKVIAECGPPITLNADPIWTCFFQFADNNPPETTGATDVDQECDDVTPPVETTTEPTLTITYADWPRLGCCDRANTTGCRDACEREYSGNRVVGSWEKINEDCIYQPNEDELVVCLADVVGSCDTGCSGLDFCENFNNRPFQPFRDCNSDADKEAKTKYNEWRYSNIIQLPLVTIQTKDITTCLPDLWKAAVCAIYTRPCDNDTHSSLLCKDDCLDLMETCSVTESLTPEEICEILSPANLQDRCVSIGQFTEPSSLDLNSLITSPCEPSPCAEGRHCIVNHDCSGNRDKACTPYTCLEEDILGKSPKMLLAATDLVHVNTLPDSGRRCYGFVQKNNDGAFGERVADLSNEYCKPVSQCLFKGNNYSHGDILNLSDGCNFCTCVYGDMICTQQVCVEATVSNLGSTPLLSCDCPALYSPVCTISGQTLPNACFASCLGYTAEQFQTGSCADEDPCDHSRCPANTKCVPQKHVCLPGANVTSCPQYSCESYFSCYKFSSPVCDLSNNQHDSLCKIFLTQKQIDYFGYCQMECSSGRSQKVCGVNGETFQTKCHALQNGIAVDYVGECTEFPPGTHGCDAVKCPGEQYFSANESCKGPIPPGACCQQCGSVLKVILDYNRLDTSRQAMNATTINSTDILIKMRSHLNLLECRLEGYVALDGSFVFLLLPTNYSTFLNVEVCNTEAVRLATLINNRSPILTTDPFLFFLAAATPSLATTQPVPPLVNEVIDPHSGCGRDTPLVFITFVLLLICGLFH